MEMFVSSVMSYLVSRFISFLVDKYGKQTGAEDTLESLQQVLLRIHTIVEEAEGRHITNQRMLRQLKMLMEGMYRGYYVLDTFKYRALREKDHDEVSPSFALSSFNPAKRLRTIGRTAKGIVFGDEGINELRSILGSLETIVENAKEFTILLGGYPRLVPGLNDNYLHMDKCMFGRQVERKQVINFLLQDDPHGHASPGVLPIIGDRFVGKKTLVEHVCNDERVRDHFSLIVLFDGDDLGSKTLTALEDTGEIKHQKFINRGRSLIVVEFSWDVDLEAWRRFYSGARFIMEGGSKIIIVSTCEEAASLGTVESIKLKSLSQEEYWYFFKTLAFRSADPEEHPKLASVCKEIATGLNGSFLSANIWFLLLRANFNAQFWCQALRIIMDVIKECLLLFGEHPKETFEKSDPVKNARRAMKIIPICLDSNHAARNTFFLLEHSARDVSHRELPKLTMQNLLSSASVPPEGEFDVLLWQSRIPPYHNIIASCTKKRPRSRRKQLRRKSRCHLQPSSHST